MHEVLVVAECDLGLFQAAVAFDVHVLRAVDHDFRDRRLLQQELERAEALVAQQSRAQAAERGDRQFLVGRGDRILEALAQGVRRAICEGLLGSDIVGLQTDRYADQFLDTVASFVRDARVDRDGRSIRWRDRRIRVGTYPISIDPDESMREYVLLQLKVRAMRDMLFRSRIFNYLAAATPGLKELVTIGKIWELAQLDRKVNRLFYDDAALTPDRYRAWLDRAAVRWVAVPDVALDYSAHEEADLIARQAPVVAGAVGPLVVESRQLGVGREQRAAGGHRSPR